jgi:hypothetical protein
VLAALVAGGCLHDEARDAEQGDSRSGFVVVEAGSERDANTRYVVGREAFGLRGTRSPVRLGGAVDATLLGTLAPVAVPSPRRGDVLAYSSSAARVPFVRAHYAASRYDVVVAKGAISVAWGSRGLAYVEAPRARLGSAGPYVGHVVVRRKPGASPVRWTVTPAQYVVAAWAGRRLLAYRLRRSWPDLLVLDGPRRLRRLARAGALVAVSPDGRRAFVSSYDVRPPVVRVIDVATGRKQAELRLRSEGVRWLIESGSWVGDEVVAPASAGLVVFRVRAGTISVEQILRFRSDAFPVLEPRLEADGRHIVARVELASRPREAVAGARLLRCDRRTLRCASVASGSSAHPPRGLYNPSRP